MRFLAARSRFIADTGSAAARRILRVERKIDIVCFAMALGSANPIQRGSDGEPADAAAGDQCANGLPASRSGCASPVEEAADSPSAKNFIDHRDVDQALYD